MKRIIAGLMIAAASLSPALAEPQNEALSALAASEIAALAASPELIAAVRAQNERTAGFDQAEIDRLDTAWRAQITASDQPMIAGVLQNPASLYLKEQRDLSQGLMSEIFVMDAKGLNVAQSDVTSDYWQGDEDKFLKTFPAGPDATHISDIEFDESSQRFQSQISRPIVDPESGAVIGVLTAGIDVETLAH